MMHLFQHMFGRIINYSAYLQSAAAFEPIAPRVHARFDVVQVNRGNAMAGSIVERTSECLECRGGVPVAVLLITFSLSLSLSTMTRPQGPNEIAPGALTPRAGRSCPTNSGKKMNTS
jgi:hypothetical protein